MKLIDTLQERVRNQQCAVLAGSIAVPKLTTADYLPKKGQEPKATGMISTSVLLIKPFNASLGLSFMSKVMLSISSILVSNSYYRYLPALLPYCCWIL